jgi:hypothetical protein
MRRDPHGLTRFSLSTFRLRPYTMTEYPVILRDLESCHVHRGRGGDAAEHDVRLNQSDLVIAAQWAESAAEATHAAALLPLDVTVATHGHVLFGADFLSRWPWRPLSTIST